MESLAFLVFTYLTIHQSYAIVNEHPYTYEGMYINML